MAQQLLFHPVELQAAFVVPVDSSQEGALFKAHNDAFSMAKKHFEKVMSAVLFTTNCEAVLRGIELKGGLEAIPRAGSLETQLPPFGRTMLRQSELHKLVRAYDIVSGDKYTDQILSWSVHRFVLGRQRTDDRDRLVDYVTAWESILLTQNGQPVPQELSYRFAVNGSSLITQSKSANSPVECYRNMKSPYAVRSQVVHGGGGADRSKALSKALRFGDFESIADVCNYLESKFREVIFLLADWTDGGRPYQRLNGWEELLWQENASQPRR